MDLREIGWGGIDWVHQTQDMGQFEDSCKHGNEASGFIKCLEIFEFLSDCWLLKKESPP
jgi:hypothetical protein